jgi:hypothetical protein
MVIRAVRTKDVAGLPRGLHLTALLIQISQVSSTASRIKVLSHRRPRSSRRKP